MSQDKAHLISRSGFNAKYLGYIIAAVVFYVAITSRNILYLALPYLALSLSILSIILLLNKERVAGTAKPFFKYIASTALAQLLFLAATIAVFSIFKLQVAVNYKIAALNFADFKHNAIGIYAVVCLTAVVAYRVSISYYNNNLAAGISGIILPKAERHPWFFVRNFLLITVLVASLIPIIIISSSIILALLHLVTLGFGATSPLENYFLLSVVGVLSFLVIKQPLKLWFRYAVRVNFSLAKILIFYLPLLAIVWMLSYYCIYELGNSFSTATEAHSFLDKTGHGPALLLWSWFFLSIPLISSRLAAIAQGRSFFEILLASLILPMLITLLAQADIITLTSLDITAWPLQLLSIAVLLVALYFSCSHIYAVHHLPNGFMPVTKDIRKRSLIKLLVPFSSVIALSTSAFLVLGWQLAQMLSTAGAILLLLVLFALMISYIRGLVS